MSVRAVVVRSMARKTYWLDVMDGEIRPMPHSTRGASYRVTGIEVVKTEGNVTKVTLSGPVLKKDGTDSLNGANENLYGHSHWPTWLRSVIGGLA